jgi:hypothetical protein
MSGQLLVIGAEKRLVEITQCPYDYTTVEAETFSGGSVIMTCPACEAAWEWHGAWVRRVREPDRDKMIAARTRSRATVPAS